MIFEKLQATGVEQVGLFYLGESLLLKSLPNAIRLAKEFGFKNVFLTTNGSLAAPDFVRELMAAGLDSLKFSLNYSDAEQMADVAGVGPGIYNLVNDNIRLAHQLREKIGYKCELNASYINYDGAQGERMATRVASLLPYLDNVYILPLYTQAGATETQADWRPIRGNPGRVGAERHPVPCWVLFSQAHVTVDGKLSACCFDHNQVFEVGDLNTGTFEEAWNSEAFRALRRAHLAGDVSETVCRDCILT
jgi:radical SAM protein with 4Fe4S-binding SPASM domain